MIRQAQYSSRQTTREPHSTGSSHSARRPGGFVADAAVHPVEGEQDQPSANITLRIPASELTES